MQGAERAAAAATAAGGGGFPTAVSGSRPASASSLSPPPGEALGSPLLLSSSVGLTFPSFSRVQGGRGAPSSALTCSSPLPCVAYADLSQQPSQQPSSPHHSPRPKADSPIQRVKV